MRQFAPPANFPGKGPAEEVVLVVYVTKQYRSQSMPVIIIIINIIINNIIIIINNNNSMPVRGLCTISFPEPAILGKERECWERTQPNVVYISNNNHTSLHFLYSQI
jgi:hypothetical protein